MNIKKTVVWGFFSSVKLAIWLIAVIAVASLIGTFIPQNQAPTFYIERFGNIGYNVLMKTGLADIYSSWWFVLLLAIFSLNLTVCLLNRLPLKVRLLGTFISHLSILIILAGAFIGIVYGQKGLITIHEGETVCCFTDGAKKIEMGFSIRLDDFIYTEHIDPKEKLLIYYAKPEKGDGLISEAPTEVGAIADIADTGYKIKVLRYLNDFAMDTSTKAAANRSARPNNPAVEIALTDKGGKTSTFWVFARFPDMHQKEDPKFKFIYNWVGRKPKDFISKVTILQSGNVVMRKDILVNSPLSFGGYKFFQSTFDTERLSWSGLQAVRDPGVPVVYAGFLLLIVGFTIIFYVNPIIQRR